MFKIAERVCLICNKKYVPSSNNQKYCELGTQKDSCAQKGEKLMAHARHKRIYKPYRRGERLRVRYKIGESQKERAREKELKNKYDISIQDYNMLLLKQKGKCAICPKDITENHRKLAVDHCHKTGRVRGLLCLKCNVGIGCFNDSTSTLQSAILYISSDNLSN